MTGCVTGTHEGDIDAVPAFLISTYLRIIRRGDMLAERWTRNRGILPRTVLEWAIVDGRGEKKRDGGNRRCRNVVFRRNIISRLGTE